MLTIVVTISEGFNEATSEFVDLESFELQLEHSLVSLSKWESHWEKPFLSTTEKSQEEMLWYVQAMTLTPNVPSWVWDKLSDENLSTIYDYMNKKMTATWSPDKKDRPSREIVTAEVMYYWMAALGINFECQHWHLNRFLTLVQVCNHKNSPPKKMGQKELAERNRRLNEERLAKYGTKG